MITVDEVISRLSAKAMIGRPHPALELPTSTYHGHKADMARCPTRIGLAVESMRRHTSDEGWQLFAGLESAGYELVGFNLGENLTDAPRILSYIRPDVVVLQDKREWDGRTAGAGFDSRERFTGVEVLKDRTDIFKLTVLKDAHQNLHYHRYSADEIGCHAWIIYYHPKIVKHLAPYVREQHLIRTYHSVDSDAVPTYFATGRDGALLSGALSSAYPLRQRLVEYYKQTGFCGYDYQPHPGYGRSHCHTNDYLRLLSRYKVAICTASIYGYSLRRLIEATACGCIVVTDLPHDDILPGIDGNLVRIHPDESPQEVVKLVERLVTKYNHTDQNHYALTAKRIYDYRTVGRKLADDIEELRRRYNG